MSWYSIFYWITVADGVKDFFDTFSNIFTFLTIMSFIALAIAVIYRNSETREGDDKRVSANFWLKNFRKLFIWCFTFAVLTWAGYVFCPNKRDALIIVAGGAVGEFIASDSSAKQIPSEVMTLLRDKIRSEIKEVKLTDQIRDTLQDKTREELIELLKNK